MDWLTFISKLIEALAWPITIFLLALKFRDRVQELLGKLTEISLPGGISGKFEAPLQSAEQIAHELDLDLGADATEESKTDPIALAANPTGVIMEAWKELALVGADLILMSRVPGMDLQIVSGAVGKDVLRELEKRGLIPDNEVKLLRELREIRNRAAHSTDRRPTVTEAERFLSIVKALESAWIGRMAVAVSR
ncbi:DUF4145 domain-containing protein [Burkholderia ambifaria]|uniref:DUF4145 domain-containing protein n=1 Tax=Burkholderia ambifaria TaxID=152480 RepID=UPI00158CD69F|nr:hypothetical protein [Burkholderia ambifaria]